MTWSFHTEDPADGRLLHVASPSTLKPHHSTGLSYHLAVTPTGVFVIDAKKYRGRPHLKIEGGLLRPRVEKLLVGTRDCTKLVDGALKQVGIVREVVRDQITVQGVLCFVEADWPLFGGSFTTRGVEVMWPKKLYPLLQAGDRADMNALEDVYRRLASALPPA